MGIPLFIGLGSAYFWPYLALEIGQYTILLLMGLMLMATINSKWGFRSIILDVKSPELWVGIFLCLALIPAIAWLVLFYFLDNTAISYGFFWASLCPVALVAPQFVQTQKGDESFAYSLMVVTSLLSPLSIAVMLKIFYPEFSRLQLLPQIKDMFFVSVLPCLVGTIFKNFLIIKNWLAVPLLKKGIPLLNMLIIGVLAYSFMGSTILRLNLNSIHPNQIVILFFFCMLLDFLVFFLTPYILIPLKIPPSRVISLTVSLSMKNVAISGAILLFDLPQAALGSCLMFVAHGIFFSYLTKTRVIFLGTIKTKN